MNWFKGTYHFILITLFQCKLYGQYVELIPELKSYYTLINKAELAILDSNYIIASQFYEDAFSKKQYPFCSDQYNKAICEILLEKFDKAHESLTYLVEHNYSIDTLITNSSFTPYFRSKYGSKLKRIAEINSNKFQNESHYYYDTLLYRDQELRSDINYEWTEALRTRDSLNAYGLLNHMQNNGFPTEQSVGLYDNYHLNKALWIVFAHNSVLMGRINSHLNLNDTFLNVLINAISTGEADIRTYNYLLEAHFGFSIFGENYHTIFRVALTDSTTDNTILSPMLLKNLPDTSELNSINQIRLNSGLPSLEDQRKKLRVAIKYSKLNHPNFSFLSECHGFNHPSRTFESNNEYQKYLIFLNDYEHIE